MFPIHLVSMLRMCGAITIPGLGAGTGVTINNLIPALQGDNDNHMNLGALINILQHNVNIGGIPAIPSIVSMASPDILGLIPHVQGLPIPMQGSPNVFVGKGSGSAGIGMMQPIFGALGQVIGFNPLQVGELVSMAGQVVGMVSQFTQIGGGAAVAQMTNLQGSPLTPGSTVTGQTSGYNFTYSNYFDSRVLNNVPGGASYGSANSYPAINTISNALVTDSGDYIVIEDYITFYPTMNLTASVITV